MFRVVKPSPAVLLSAAITLGTATFVAVPLLAQNLLAQNGEPAKPAEAGKAEPAKGEPSKGDPSKAEAKEAVGRPDESAETSRILMGPPGHGECIWLGERAVVLMWKDDLDTAFRHLDLYDRFGCPGEHIRVSFRCVVRQGDPQKDSQKDPKFFNDRVHACWMNPALPAAPANPPTAAVEKPGTK